MAAGTGAVAASIEDYGSQRPSKTLDRRRHSIKRLGPRISSPPTTLGPAPRCSYDVTFASATSGLAQSRTLRWCRICLYGTMEEDQHRSRSSSRNRPPVDAYEGVYRERGALRT